MEFLNRPEDGRMRGEAQVYIEATPDKVFQLVSDVTRTGQWSPECYRCGWLGGATGPTVGARFKGHNRRGLLRWSITSEVTAAEPGRVFAFETESIIPFMRKRQTLWRYEMEPSGSGTTLTEAFNCNWYYRIIVLSAFGGAAARQAQLEANLRYTLDRIKQVAEAS